MSKNLYIISGCNGAGKTTASYTVLPEILECKEFVNADEIARGLSPFNPESMAIEAGRLMLQRIDDLLGKDITFAIETTLATKSYINLVRRAQAKGYRVSIVFFWLRTPELAIQRVAERVKHGGHNIPEDTIEAINSAKQHQKRVVALGTTVARTLEFYGKTGKTHGEDDIFIYPGFDFTVIDALLTNFHAPKSTVLMLASAFAGWDHLKNAYAHAVDEKYNFLSYGDSMLIC